jgi:hypothetical protein
MDAGDDRQGRVGQDHRQQTWLLVLGSHRRRPGWADHDESSSRTARADEPLNETRDKEDQITYKSLWVHAKRHYDLAGIAAYWTSRINKELRNALGDNSYRTTIK